MDKKDTGRGSLLRSPNVVNILTIIIVTSVCIILVLVLAKGLFASNSKDVPAGLNTGTVAGAAAPAAQTVTSPSATPSASASASGTGAGASAAAVTTVTAAEVDDSVAYVVTYVQLKAQPNPDSANVICMSPNIKVKILERRDDGFIHLSFLNGDGSTLSGYVKTEYLSPTPVERTTTTTVMTEAPAAETAADGTTAPGQTTAARSNNALIETVEQ